MVVLNTYAPRKKQQGITLVLISLVMLFLLGMAAFSIDLNHQVLNKTRLQNAVDSAALAGAVVADETNDVDLAEAAARATLASFINEDGNGELEAGNDSTSVTFSYDLQNFVDAGSFSPPSGENDIYIRVDTEDVELNQFLSYVFGLNKNVSASAVSGRSAAIGETCNITPMAMCGEPTGNADDAWGYQQPGVDILNQADNNSSQIHALKVGSHNNTDMGPGNFQLLDFGQDASPGQGGGAALVRDAMSGAYNGCATIGETVTTKPGNSIGPVAQGLNTRLNDFAGPIKNDGSILPDKYVREPDNKATEGEDYQGDLYYSDYVSELANCESGGCGSGDYLGDSGSSGRRILRVPIVDCTDAGGKTEFDVLGFGCFFLLQKVSNSGQSAVFGQFLYECQINNGSTGVDPTDSALFRIQLYKDPLSGAS